VSSTGAPRAAIAGLAGLEVTAEEAALFQALPPAGFILFTRNCASPAQVLALTASLRALTAPWRPLLLIDQEGGRVARLRPPHWPAIPPMAVVGAMAARDRAAGERLAVTIGRLLAAELRPLGIDVDCAPVLDLRWPGATEAIGDRAFGFEAELVAMLGVALARGLRDGGVIPVMKHLPGHGRATVDSHATLPRVRASRNELVATDMVPFMHLAASLAADQLMAMTAHVVYEAIDPFRPATLSPAVIGDLVRDAIGFSGVLLSDDLAMGALAARAAGCDLALWCAPDLGATRAVLAAAGPCDAALCASLAALCEGAVEPTHLERAALVAEVQTLLQHA
jgi:beta-N-acetylhexosaminidase